ncbi:unnamed protein product [Oikopleura dioica]|uniref:Polysaccharide biosynthesis domain-containing protein n=1 Tax=Oikopleura dioica TaxID=34765 RepID=E4XK23_OIKDI|nr:unnamed protein product [Oikopleura dioica]
MASFENKWTKSGFEADSLPKAFQQAQVHMKLLVAVGPSKMKFSPQDDAIYESFRKEFPKFDVTNVKEDLHEAIKSGENSEQWKNWMEQFKDTLKDSENGSLLRIDPSNGYTTTNSTICVRAQFLAIEIARNKENHNKSIVNAYKKAASGNSGGCCSKC